MLHRIVSRYAGVFAAASLGLGLAACEDNTAGTPLPPPPPSTAVVVSAVAPVPEDGVVDTDVAVPAIFKATNPDGSAAANVVIQFTAVGAGLVEHTEATTAADGTASPGVWHLGRTSGTQRLTAAAPSGDPAFIDVAVAPGSFAALNSPAGLPNSAQIANRPTAVAPAFVVADEFNNIAGDSIPVTFEALEGSIDDTDPVLSNSSGRVSPGAWTLDGTIGPQRLVASYVVDGAPVKDTITVEAVCTLTLANFGVTIGGQWRTSDCDNGTNLINAYRFSAADQSSFSAVLSGGAGQGLQLRTPTGTVLQDVLPTYLYSTSSNPYEVNYVVTGGAYESWALAPALAALLNSYTLTNNGSANGVDNYLPAVGCAQVGNRPFFGMIGIDAFNFFRAGNICNAGAYATYQDRYLIQLTAGEEFEAIAIQSAGMAATTVLSLRIRDARTAAGAIVATGVPAGATGANARTLVADYTAAFTGLYEVIVGSPVNVGLPIPDEPDLPPFEYEIILTTP